MCKASVLFEKLSELTNQCMNEKKRLEKLQSQLDREVNKFYHDLEARGSFNAAEGFYIARDFQKLLRKRRVVKQELYTLIKLNSSLQFNQINTRLPEAKKCLNTIQRDRIKGYAADWKLTVEDVEQEYAH